MSLPNLKSAFNLIVKLSSRKVKLRDSDSGTEEEIFLSPSNFFRNLTAVEETVIAGREFVITVDELKRINFNTLERGWKIIEEDESWFTIEDIRPMHIMGMLVGYRVRTN